MPVPGWTTSMPALRTGTAYSATGQATWVYPFTYAAEGRYTIHVEAVDNVGHRESAGPFLHVIADGKPPGARDGLSADHPVPQREWALDRATRRIAYDAEIQSDAIYMGSGVDPASLVLSIQAEDGTQLVQQRVDYDGYSWSTTVELPSSMGDPTGAYSVNLRAVDMVGNSSDAHAGLRLDVAQVTAAIDPASQVIDYVTKPMTPTGAITGSMGLGAVEGAFVPIEQTAALSETTLISVWMSPPARSGSRTLPCIRTQLIASHRAQAIRAPCLPVLAWPGVVLSPASPGGSTPASTSTAAPCCRRLTMPASISRRMPALRYRHGSRPQPPA